MEAPGRFTRSRAAPDWTLQELFTLACEVAAVEEDCRGAFSAHQRWKIVADHCAALGVPRTDAQCRRKWDALSTECRAIERWEGSRGRSEGSYWCTDRKLREDLGLPPEFDRELFGLVTSALAVQEGPVPEDADSDGLEAAGDGIDDEEKVMVLAQLGNKKTKGKGVKDDNDSLPETVKPNHDGKHGHLSNRVEEMLQESKNGGTKASNSKSTRVLPISKRIQDMIQHLQGHADQMESILPGYTPGGNSSYLTDLKEPNATDMESTRRQADQLIRAVESLRGSIGQLCTIVKEELPAGTGS